MRIDISVLVSVLALAIFIQSVSAVPFNASVSPTSLNAGQTNQLLNFTVENNGSANVGQVNITLPSGFSFTGSSGTTSSSYTFSSSPLGWSNISSTALVSSSGGTQYFWIYVNTPGSTGSNNFNVSVFDANGVYNSSNVPVSITDTIAPVFSSNTTSPSSNSTYTANKDYWFNLTWTDGIAVSKVLLEHNFTGSSSVHNESMSNNSNVYYARFTDLSAGTYAWRTYANDTSNTFNSTPQYTYTVAQSSNQLQVYLNGTLNANITSINNTAINTTVNSSCSQSSCTISITLDGSSTLVSGGSNPVQYINTLTSVGLHTYNVTVAGNTNYTAVTATYSVATVPTSATSTLNIPLTWANNTYSSINITFDSDASLQGVLIQGDWSGTVTNYTMSNYSGSRFYYNTSFPAGTFTWRLYGLYSGYGFNLTAASSFTINPYAPNITLNIVPQWTLDVPIQTNVSCAVGITSLTAKLYRNGSLASNPDVQTFNVGDIYVYICNNTVNQNYTTTNLQNTLFIRPKPLATLSFTQSPSIIQIVQGSASSTEIKVKNTGSLSQDVTMTLTGIDNNWYSIKNTTLKIFSGLTGTFSLNFTIPSTADVKDYNVVYQAKGSNATISQNFTLRVLPSNETKIKIADSFTQVKSDVSALENKINQLNSNGINVSSIQPQLNELKSLVTQTDSYISSNDYFNAYQNIQKIKSNIQNIETQLNSLTQPLSGINLPQNVWMIIGGFVAIIVIGVIAYLAWPVKEGYREDKGEYNEGKPGIFDKKGKSDKKKQEDE